VPGHSGNDVWAPDVQLFNGRVWLYYSISTFGSNTSAIGLASKASLSASGGWRDDGLVIRSISSNNYNAIDPNLAIDAAGQPWLAFGSFWTGIKLTRIDPATMKPTGSLASLASRSGGIEAPVIVYRGPYYYLFVSIDRCCNGVNSTYKITYGRATSITGPYVDKNGTSMLNGGGTLLESGSERWRGPGGQDVHGTSVLARHAYDATANGAPKLLINDLFWDSAGWPTYSGGGTPSPSPTPTPLPGSVFRIVNRNSGKCLDVNGRSLADGADVIQWACTGATNQQWRIEATSGGYSRFVSVNSGKVLDVANCGTADGTNVQQWTWLNNHCQQWRTVTTDGAWVRIENRNSAKVLDVASCGTADGTDVRQWTWLNNNCQQWQLQQP
jgi:arabinan endo-1,5-alpha-L-arabinosidase